MRQFLIVVFFSICSIASLMAQSISGKVIDEKNNPLPYVSVVLQNIQDSSYVGGVATNPEGLFNLPVKSDVEYALSVSYIGYVTVDKVCKAGDIGTIVMKEDAMMLEEVSVIASRTQHDAMQLMKESRCLVFQMLPSIKKTYPCHR